MGHLNHGVKGRIPQAPWVLYFDGASRKPAASGALGIVLKNSRGQVVEEERKFLGAGVSSGLAKYKALLAGLKKAKGLHVKHLLAKGNSPILINQVVGRWTVRDAHLRDQLKQVWGMAKEFDSLFMEFIPKEHNVHADRIANAAIDKELQIQEVVSSYFDRSCSGDAWQKEPPPARTLLLQAPFSNPKLRPISPLREPPHDSVVSSSGTGKPLASALKRSLTVTIASPSVPVVGDDAHTSDSDLTTTIKSLSSSKADKFWAARLSISDEANSSSSRTASEEVGYFQPSLIKPEAKEEAGRVAASTAKGCAGDGSVEEVACEEEEKDELEEDPEFCKSRRLGTAAHAEGPATPTAAATAAATLQLSEADCDCLVEAVLERMKRTRLVNADLTKGGFTLRPRT